MRSAVISPSSPVPHFPNSPVPHLLLLTDYSDYSDKCGPPSSAPIPQFPISPVPQFPIYYFSLPPNIPSKCKNYIQNAIFSLLYQPRAMDEYDLRRNIITIHMLFYSKSNKLVFDSFLFFILLCFSALVQANNIQVSNVQRDSFNVSEQWAQVKFDITWENSWRTALGPANWDAAWVFVKFKVGGSNPQLSNASSRNDTITVSSTAKLRPGMPVRIMSGSGTLAANSVIKSIPNSTQFVLSATPTGALSAATIECIRIWEHAYLDTTDSRHTAPEGSTVNAPNDSVGAFIYRSQTGFGTFSLTGVRLRWKWGSNGIAPPNTDTLDIRVFAIEMVYVPQGSFAAGSGGTEWFPFTLTTINTANATTAASGTGSLGGAGGGYPTGETAPSNSTWPNGYDAFYCMKYEISQGQYRDFLNHLTYNQQNNRTETVPSDALGTGAMSSTNAIRNGIDIQTPGVDATCTPALYACNLDGDGNYNESDDGEWIACNFISWMDGCAYTDWAGLRPMSELEFEKACRGTQAPVADEYAWGSTSITGATGISNGGASNETYSNTGANCAYNNNANVQGPLRVGAFAGGATTRAQAGATYYGIMEMSGNLLERIVTINVTTGRAFTGVHGNGGLSDNGHANQTNWPGINGSEVTGAAGSGFRGSGWSFGEAFARVSDRNIASVNSATNRYDYSSFRGVRSAIQ
jgi:formylglycine-generating enzyme required for sulfatase activity